MTRLDSAQTYRPFSGSSVQVPRRPCRWPFMSMHFPCCDFSSIMETAESAYSGHRSSETKLLALFASAALLLS